MIFRQNIWRLYFIPRFRIHDPKGQHRVLQRIWVKSSYQDHRCYCACNMESVITSTCCTCIIWCCTVRVCASPPVTWLLHKSQYRYVPYFILILSYGYMCKKCYWILLKINIETANGQGCISVKMCYNAFISVKPCQGPCPFVGKYDRQVGNLVHE